MECGPSGLCGQLAALPAALALGKGQGTVRGPPTVASSAMVTSTHTVLALPTQLVLELIWVSVLQVLFKME